MSESAKLRRRKRQINQRLRKIYRDPANPAGYASPRQLLAELKRSIPDARIGEVREWLFSQPVYTLHRRVVKRFPRRPTVVPGVREQYQADLLSVARLKRENSGVTFLLNVIDCLSRYATSIPLRSKRGKDVKEGLRKAFRKMGVPKMLQTDRGSEFYNLEVSRFLKRKGVQHFSSHSDYKAAQAERFNRTIKEKITAFVRDRGRLRYLEALPQILRGYNSRPRDFLDGLAPDQVNSRTQRRVMQRLTVFPKRAAKFRVGDEVRLAEARFNFKRSYHQNFTDATYLVDAILPTRPITYRVRRSNDGRLVGGSFYAQQMQKVN